MIYISNKNNLTNKLENWTTIEENKYKFYNYIKFNLSIAIEEIIDDEDTSYI